jgi:subtilisin family serine protease
LVATNGVFRKVVNNTCIRRSIVRRCNQDRTVKRIFNLRDLTKLLCTALFLFLIMALVGTCSRPASLAIAQSAETPAPSEQAGENPTTELAGAEGQNTNTTTPALDTSASTCNPNSETIKYGDKGPKVVEIQTYLTQLGYRELLGKHGPNQAGIDGIFGDDTRSTVIKFQEDQHLKKIDGRVGPETWPVLCNLVASARPATSPETRPVGSTEDSPKFVPNSYIVLLNYQRGHLKETIESLIPDLTAASGYVGVIYDHLGGINLRFAGPQTQTAQFLETLRTNPAVKMISRDVIFNLAQVAQQPDDGINRVGADLSSTRSGDQRGVVNANIAIIDGGVQHDHPDLTVYVCFDFTAYNSEVSQLYQKSHPALHKLIIENMIKNKCVDETGHGTHVAGIAAAKDNNIGTVGVAPGAKILALDVCTKNDDCAFNGILGALDYVLGLWHVIDVVNISLGSEGEKDVLSVYKDVIDRLAKLGVPVVVAAGNDNMDVRVRAPAGIPSAITVSAITDSDGKCGGIGSAVNDSVSVRGFDIPFSNLDDSIASYSNYGSDIDIAAPGTNIRSTWIGGGYQTITGTSMAAPHVAGAIALYKSIHGHFTTVNEIETFLHDHAISAPATTIPGAPLQPCDGHNNGYYRQLQPSGIGGGSHSEPLLNVADIR